MACSDGTNSISKLVFWDSGAGRFISSDEGSGFGGRHSCRGGMFPKYAPAEQSLYLDMIISPMLMRKSQLPAVSLILSHKEIDVNLYKCKDIPK